MERGQAIHLAKYGRQKIERHDVFSTAKDAKDFLKAYAFYQNKLIDQPVSSGHKKVWECTSESACDWQVTLTKKSESKAESKRQNTKNNFCPEKAWFVSDLFLEHSPGCDSIGKSSKKLLTDMPGFQSAIVPVLSSSRKRVTESVKLVDNVNIAHRSAMLYKAIALAKKNLAAVTDDTYDKLPAFLRSFERQNPGSRVCCQIDSMGRFYRAFLSLGSLVAGHDNWIPILECDGTHMKHEKSNGVCVLLVGKDGDWSNIPVAVAFVHKETADNFEWFFANCIVAGIKLHDRAVFSDRGKQREAQIRLRNRWVIVHLKFCSLHIFFNVCHHFRSVEANIEHVRDLVFRRQEATTLVEYDVVLAEIASAFPNPRTVNVNGVKQTQTVAEYLCKIHPTSWTQFGNCTFTPEEAAAVKSRWGIVESYGDPCALFAGRTTSAVEGQNNGLLLAGIRDNQVFGALLLFWNAMVEILHTKQKNAKGWMENSHTVTPRAETLFDKQVWAAARCTVRKSTATLLYADEPTRNSQHDGTTASKQNAPPNFDT